MSYSVRKQQNISYQPPDKRRYNRFINPIKICIEGEWYESVNWSVDGFKISGYTGNLTENETVGADIMLVFQGAGITLWREVRVLRSVRKAGVLVAKFIDDNPVNHDWLIHFCNRLVTGEYQYINAPITEDYVKQTFQDREKEGSPGLKRHTFVQAYIAVGIIVAYLLLSGVISNYFFLKTDFAAVSGGTEVITSPSGGIVTDIYVKKGEFTEKGQPLFKTSDPKIEQEAEFKRNEILKNEALLEEKQITLENRRRDVSVAAGTQKESISAASGEIRLLKAELAKKTLLYQRQLVSEPEITGLKREILEQEQKLTASSGKLQQEGDLDDLKAEVARISKVLDIDRKELAWIEATNERNTVRASFKATVKEIPAFEGKFVDEKTPVVVLKAVSGEKQVKAYITKLEALKLRLGADAKIEIPSRNLKMKGKLIRLEEEQQVFNKELAVAVIQPENPQLIENIDEGTPIKLIITKRKWF
jgi:multidrug resistance efflux pump